MVVTVITPPAPLLSVPDAKIMSPALADADDLTVFGLLNEAQARIEPPISFIGRSFGLQTLEASFDEFDTEPMYLQFPPLVSITSVKYNDSLNVEQTLSPSIYQLWGVGSLEPYIKLVSGSSWPTTYVGSGVVRIRYQTGYAVTHPTLYIVRRAIVLMASHILTLSETDLSLRSETVDGVGSQTWSVSDAAQVMIDNTVDRLLSPLRIIAL